MLCLGHPARSSHGVCVEKRFDVGNGNGNGPLNRGDVSREERAFFVLVMTWHIPLLIEKHVCCQRTNHHHISILPRAPPGSLSRLLSLLAASASVASSRNTSVPAAMEQAALARLQVLTQQLTLVR